MFQLRDHQATLAHMSTYSEKHGEDIVHGIALKLETSVTADNLSMFDRGLPGLLFSNGAPRYPEINSVRWDRELFGALVTIDADDLLGERTLSFVAVVDKFDIEPLPANAASITLRVKIKPEPEEVACLYELQQQDVMLTIEPASTSGKKPKTPNLDLVDKAIA